MTELTRAFFALPVPPALRAALAAVQARLQGRVAGSKLRPRFVDTATLHLTIKFLGEVDRTQLAQLRLLVPDAAALTPPTAAQLRGIAAFRRPQRARVIVAELRDQEGRLRDLADRIEQGSRAAGVPAESRAFRPHVTLARLRRPGDVRSWLDPPAPASADCFDQLVLYRSVLKPAGPQYDVLAEAPLGGSAPAGDLR